MIKSDIAPMAA